MFGEFDRLAMARALALAERGLETTHPNPRVGCVIAKDDRIIAEGWHERAGEAHAEVAAIRAAKEPVAGATAYVTLEPCSHHGRTPPCVNALIEASIARVIFAVQDPNPQVSGQGAAALLRAGIVTESGLMQAEATELNVGFMKRMREGRPWVRLKLAMSLDGRTALANGASQWITGEQARMDVQHWRARSSAVATGVGTMLADDPLLNVRVAGFRGRQPLRVVLDARLRSPAAAKMFGGSNAGPQTAGTAQAAQAPAPLAEGAAAGGDVLVFSAVGGGVFATAGTGSATERPAAGARGAADGVAGRAAVATERLAGDVADRAVVGTERVAGRVADRAVVATERVAVSVADRAVVGTERVAGSVADRAVVGTERVAGNVADRAAGATEGAAGNVTDRAVPGADSAAAFLSRRAALLARGVRIEEVAAEGGFLDLAAVLGKLAALQVNELLVEAGPTLAGQLLTGRLVDELLLYIAPKLLGPQGRPLVSLPELQSLQDALGFSLLDAERFGPDLRLRMRPK